jgi:hypothetical protein
VGNRIAPAVENDPMPCTGQGCSAVRQTPAPVVPLPDVARQLPRDDQGYVKLDELTVDGSRARSMSMYEPTTRFRLLERAPLGLIAVSYDERVDELQAASHLPQATTFVENDVPVSRRDPRVNGFVGVPPVGGRGLRLRLLEGPIESS